MRRLTLPLLLALSVEAAAQERRLFDDPKAVGAWLAESNVPAVGVAVIRDGVLRQVHVYGELQQGSPAPFDTVFNVASLTKPVVSMLVLRLVSAGEWDLDEPLSKYWTDPEVADDPRHAKLTTRHVLSHQTGFANWRWLHPTKKLTFEFDPGTRVQYSGEGFEYLRRALEQKFGRPLAALSRERLLVPLRMNDTHHAWNEHVDERRFARWHDGSGKHAYPDHQITTVNAADNLLTTVEDYGRFAASVLANEGLSPDVSSAMIARRAPIKANHFMGLGWELHTGFSGGEYALIHSGSDEGVHALVILVPKSRQGLVVMTNGDNGFRLYEKLVVETLDLGAELMARAR
jgi:CubicO group peptidase (beta-lactamase class C family)